MQLLIHAQTSAVHRWSFGMDMEFHPRLYIACSCVSMLGLKYNHVSKRRHSTHKLIYMPVHSTCHPSCAINDLFEDDMLKWGSKGHLQIEGGYSKKLYFTDELVLVSQFAPWMWEFIPKKLNLSLMKVNLFCSILNLAVQNIKMYFGKMYDTLINVECSCNHLGHVVTNKTGYKQADWICQADLGKSNVLLPTLNQYSTIWSNSCSYTMT